MAIQWLIGTAVAALVLSKARRARAPGPAILYWDGGSYTVTPEDELWLKRAVAGEAGNRDWVAQTLVNRFVFLRAKGLIPNLSLKGLIRAYAQPVNPIWENRGTPKEIERRRIARTRTEFSADTEEAVKRALYDGPTSIPSSSVHYAAPGKAQNPDENIQLTPDTPKENTLWASKSSTNWPGYRVG